MISPYEFAILNCAEYIRDNLHKVESNDPPLNAFQLSQSLGIAFMKSKEEVCIDIINAAKKI